MTALGKVLIACGIKFYAKDSTGTLKPRDLTGPEKLKLFRYIDQVEEVFCLCDQREMA